MELIKPASQMTYSPYLQQKEDFDHAEMVLHVALKMAQDMDSQDGVTYIYDQLANVSFVRVSRNF